MAYYTAMFVVTLVLCLYIIGERGTEAQPRGPYHKPLPGTGRGGSQYNKPLPGTGRGGSQYNKPLPGWGGSPYNKPIPGSGGNRPGSRPGGYRPGGYRPGAPRAEGNDYGGVQSRRGPHSLSGISAGNVWVEPKCCGGTLGYPPCR